MMCFESYRGGEEKDVEPGKSAPGRGPSSAGVRPIHLLGVGGRTTTRTQGAGCWGA